MENKIINKIQKHVFKNLSLNLRVKLPLEKVP